MKFVISFAGAIFIWLFGWLLFVRADATRSEFNDGVKTSLR